MTLRTRFLTTGKASFILGGQFGSEGKGAAAAFVAEHLWADNQRFDVITTNAGSQSGHTSIYKDGIKRVVFHLPTASLLDYGRPTLQPITYLNAGAIIDVDVLMRELEENPRVAAMLFIHPNATVITDECKEAEGRSDSAQTKIASTRKGVGEALSRKVLRSGQVARDHTKLKQFVRRIDLTARMNVGQSVLVEVPQGFSLGIDQPFYPHVTSRNCTVGQAASDAGIHPSFVGDSMLVIRTYPIRVGNIASAKDAESPMMLKDPPPDNPLGVIKPSDAWGFSGGAYPAQRELTWEQLGQTPEITTVTKRIRRVFEFSHRQLLESMAAARPSIIFLAFCDYLKPGEEGPYTMAIEQAARTLDLERPQILYAYGPSTGDVHRDKPRGTDAKVTG